VDLHALRTTFCTHVSNGGVPLVQAVQLMRHNDSRQTAETYYRADLQKLTPAFAKVPTFGNLKQGTRKGTGNIVPHGTSRSRMGSFNHETSNSEPLEQEGHSPSLSATGTDGPLPQNGCPARIRTEDGDFVTPSSAKGKSKAETPGASKWIQTPGTVETVTHGLELSRIVAAWAILPAYIRAAILALVDGEKGGRP